MNAGTAADGFYKQIPSSSLCNTGDEYSYMKTVKVKALSATFATARGVKKIGGISFIRLGYEAVASSHNVKATHCKRRHHHTYTTSRLYHSFTGWMNSKKFSNYNIRLFVVFCYILVENLYLGILWDTEFEFNFKTFEYKNWQSNQIWMNRPLAHIAQNISKTCQKYFQSFIAIEIFSQRFCHIV